MNTPEGCAKEPKRDDLNSSLGIVKRAVEKTADRLSRSTSLGGKSQPSPRNHSASGRPRRLFSLTRKNRADQKSNDMDQSTENEGECNVQPYRGVSWRLTPPPPSCTNAQQRRTRRLGPQTPLGWQGEMNHPSSDHHLLLPLHRSDPNFSFKEMRP